jgi:hypothetical protein
VGEHREREEDMKNLNNWYHPNMSHNLSLISMVEDSF